MDLKQENERKPKLREKEEERKKQPSCLCTSLNALSSRALIFNGEMKGLYIEPGFEAVIYIYMSACSRRCKGLQG